MGREPEVGGDDGEDAVFGEEREEPGREDMDAGESEGLQCDRREISPRGRRAKRKRSPFARNNGILRVRDGGVVRRRNESVFASDAAAAELEIVVEEELAGGFAGLDG